jgi:hypothetical protein
MISASIFASLENGVGIYNFVSCIGNSKMSLAQKFECSEGEERWSLLIGVGRNGSCNVLGQGTFPIVRASIERRLVKNFTK